jgi:hypothetical protein
LAERAGHKSEMAHGKVKSLKKTLVVKEKDKMVYSNADWG